MSLVLPPEQPIAISSLHVRRVTTIHPPVYGLIPLAVACHYSQLCLEQPWNSLISEEMPLTIILTGQGGYMSISREQKT
jgi:hypothetical protein